MNEELKKEWRSKVCELVGEASMCWTELPQGVFESERAKRIVDDIMLILAKQQEEHQDEMANLAVSGCRLADERYEKGKQDAQEEFMKCLPEELVNTKDEADSDWFYGTGYNACIADIKSKLNSKK